MADVSKIKLGSTTYNIKDASAARSSSVGASTAGGTASRLAYYTNNTAIGASGGLAYVTGNSTASSPAAKNQLHLFGQTYGNTASNMISGVGGVFSFGDGGPQITFDSTATPGGGQAGALIYTDHDTAATGNSWHFVSNQGDWNVTSKRFHARTSISIGTDKPITSHNLYVTGTANITGNTTIGGTLGVTGAITQNGTAVSLSGHTHNYAGSSSAGGDATRALKIKDNNSTNDITFSYSKAGLDTTSWFAAWSGYELRAISPAKVLSTIGAAAASHTHSYLPLSGGTLTGALTTANGTANTIGDDVKLGDFNVAGTLGIQGANGTTGISLLKKDESWSSGANRAHIAYDGTQVTLTKPMHGFVAAAHYGGTGNTTKIQIAINSTVSWMLCFVVTLYQGYRATKVMISGYQYGSSYWYQPEAKLIADSDNTETITVYFGYTAANNLWIGFDGGNYTGVSITDVVNGYTQITDYSNLFTISNVSAFSGTTQTTITAASRANYANSAGSASSATTATKATQDESGNNIKANYAASFSISDHTITLKNKNGGSLGTVTVPDNNTWRGIQNNLTSDSTSDSLSAAQGKALKALVDGKAANSHTHYYLTTIGDQRSTATTPDTYKNTFSFLGLKNNSTVNSPSSDTYSYLVGLRGWADSSGGDSHELAFNNTGIYWRHGATSSWGSWARIYTTANKPTYSDVGAAASSHTHNYAGSSSAGGDATRALAVKDNGNNNTITIQYSGSGINSASWFCAWDGYNIRPISAANTLSAIGAAATSHTHKYAGSSSAGGDANNALKFNGLESTAYQRVDGANCYVQLTGGDGNTTGYRLVTTIDISAWSNYRGTWLISSRHSGNGILSLEATCNNGTVSQANCYGQIVYHGTNDIANDSWQWYCSSDGTKMYLFWKYNDYGPCNITIQATGLPNKIMPSNGTWMTSISTSTYGALKATTTRIATTSIGSASGWSAGSAPSLSYTSRSIPNVTSVGTAPSLSYTARSIPNVTSVGSKTSVNVTVSNGVLSLPSTIISAVTVPTLGTAIAADDITAWSAGSVPTLGTAISADDITAWSAGSVPSLTITNVANVHKNA